MTPNQATSGTGLSASIRSARRNEALWGLAFITPSMLGVLAFTLFPVFMGLWVSLTDWKILGTADFIGMDNYRTLLSDPLMPKVIRNTLHYTALNIPLGICASLLFAVALNQKIRGLAFFRTAYYLPVISATVAVGQIWRWLLADSGLVNVVLAQLHLPRIGWLSDPAYALTSLTLVSVWRGLGFNMIIFLAALQDVPEDLRESARIDGANAWQLFWHITLPLITPAIFFAVLMGVIGSFQSFDLVYAMTDQHLGGPADSTKVMGFYIWQQAFMFMKMGYAAALSYVVFAAILVATLLQWRLRGRWVYGEG